METTLTPTAGAAGPGLTAALAAWAQLPQVADALARPGSIHWVMDPGAGRIVHASEAARPLVDALAAGLADVSHQITAAAPTDATPRLARLRLDPRRIAPPALCWLARGTRDDGAPAILVIPAAPVSLPRSRPVPAATPQPAERRPEPHPGPTADAEATKRPDRFLWRIDAAGVLTTLTGQPGLADLVGQPVHDLASSRQLSGADGMLAALRERRTFRGERATLNVRAGSFQVELSGAPLGRSDAAFLGFGGFGLIRTAPSVRPTIEAVPKPPVEPASPPVAQPGAKEPGQGQAGQAQPDQVLPDQAKPDQAKPNSTGTALSTDEHAAFREIARALGARYAGDEGEPDAAVARPEGGAIMPFPGPQAGLLAGPPEVRPVTAQAAESDLLAGLPVPTLVHRNGAILAANDRLLELTGHPALADLAATGLGGLSPGLPQEIGSEGAARRTTLATADGRARPVEALNGPCSWAGEPAECLIVRPIDEADAADALTAERLARAAQAERAAGAEAALDALESGVVTLDGAGRIVAMNRAAASLLSCEPREVVGGSLVSLFDRESVLTVADLLRGAVQGPLAVSLAGRTLALDVKDARGGGRRVAVLDRPESRPGILPSEAAPPGAALGRLDRALRDSLAGMIELTDAMLKEPFGSLGDPRYRGCLTEMRASGAAMLERVGTLLDLAAVEAGSLHLEPRALDLNDVAAGCIARLQAQAARGRILVRTSFSSGLEGLEADERSVSRAASLVIEHAIRRSTAGGQIIVSTGSTDKAAVALRVRDTGAASRTADPAGAVEDGLALPRALVEANGGRLELSARAEDGTLVEIIMPTRRAASG